MSQPPPPADPGAAEAPVVVGVDRLAYYSAPAAADVVPIGGAARHIAMVLCWIAIGAGLPHVVEVIRNYGGVHQHPDYRWPWQYGTLDEQLRRSGDVFGDFAGPLLIAGAVACLNCARGGRPVLLTGAGLLLASTAAQCAYLLWRNFGLSTMRSGLSAAPVDWKIAYAVSFLAPLLLPALLLGLMTRPAVLGVLTAPRETSPDTSPDAAPSEAEADAPEAR